VGGVLALGQQRDVGEGLEGPTMARISPVAGRVTTTALLLTL